MRRDRAASVEREQLQRNRMFEVKINGRVVAQTALEDENATIGARYGAARLNPEYEAFRRVIQDYTEVSCMPYPVPRAAENECRAAYRELAIELLSNSRVVPTLGQIEITDIGKVCEGSVFIVTVRPAEVVLPRVDG
jgi:hypothetical protein